MNDTTTTTTVNPEAAFEPTEADLQDYRIWCQERDERLFAERLATDEEQAHRELCRAESDARLAAAVFAAVRGDDFQQMLADLANSFSDHDEANVRFVGGLIGTAFDLARHLSATSGEQFCERRDAMLDSLKN